MKTRLKLVAASSAMFLMIVTAVLAAALTPVVFGDATSLGGGSYRLRSDATPGWGGLDYDVPVPLRFGDISVLSTLQTPEADDNCVAGSPRFQLNVDTDGDGEADENRNVFVYTQTMPGGGCPPDTGDLAGAGGPGDSAGVYDTSQLAAGTQVSTYSQTAALFADNPVWKIVGIQLVVDSGFAFPDGEQTIAVNPTVEINLPQPGDANDCRRGGWRTLFRADGTAFRNQGHCIRYVNTGR